VPGFRAYRPSVRTGKLAQVRHAMWGLLDEGPRRDPTDRPGCRVTAGWQPTCPLTSYFGDSFRKNGGAREVPCP
jgi:hypothetical protein